MTASAKHSKLMKVLGRMAPPLPTELLDKEFSSKEMIVDLEFLLKTMKEVHPNLFCNLSIAEADSILSVAKEKILSGISRVEFYEIVASFVARIGDDHTAVELPREQYERNAGNAGPVFPFEVSIDNGILTVSRSFSTKLDGALILSINGVDSSEILERILRTISGLTPENRAKRAAMFFRQYLFFLYGTASEFKLVVEKDGVSETHVVPAVTSAYIGKVMTEETSPSSSSPYEYDINKEKGYALLSFRQCVDHSVFSSLIEKMFREIKEAEIKNLIIDLRGNGGGQSSLTDDLCSYLTDKPFSHFTRVDLKVSSQVRKYYSAICKHLAKFPLSLLPARFIHGGPWKKPVGEIVSTFGEPICPKGNELRFTGKVLALTDSFTASAASDLAVVLKDNCMGKTVGRNTGGFASSYGDSYLFSMPNTFLQCRVSHKFFVRPNGDETPGPVVPDFPVDSDSLGYAVSQFSG